MKSGIGCRLIGQLQFTVTADELLDKLLQVTSFPPDVLYSTSFSLCPSYSNVSSGSTHVDMGTLVYNTMSCLTAAARTAKTSVGCDVTNMALLIFLSMWPVLEAMKKAKAAKARVSMTQSLFDPTSKCCTDFVLLHFFIPAF